MANSVKCPLCTHDIFVDEVMTLYSAEYAGPRDDPYSTKIYDIEYYIYQCPNCGKVFIQEFIIYNDFCRELDSVYPIKYNSKSFDLRIEQMSPEFVNIYNQASEAEKHKLDKLIGIGFRRAFEALVKDYAIYRNPDDSELILKKSLKETIDKYFKNSEFEPIFRKISWLGNDHSHTYNKHEEYNVSDLKRFINACVSKIVSQLDLDELDNIESKNN